MQTKDIMKLTGLDRETLRFYEKKGIITIPNQQHNANPKRKCLNISMLNFSSYNG